MCGITGIFDPENGAESDRLAAMNECLDHRGPDDSGLFIEGSIGLAHRRLSIIDLSTGEQPMYNEDESVVVIFNGEIYNYLTLRERLEDAGHTFRSESDTEVIVHLYEERGIQFTDELDGMFAIALWDREEKRLVLARDPMGIKPLVMGADGRRVVFGSELSAILASGLELGGLDTEAFSQYFAFGFIPAPKTAFRNARKLQPGEVAVVTQDGVDRHHTPRMKPRLIDPPLDDTVRRTRDLVTRAVEKRLQSDVPLGAFLSGGIDSSIICGIMSRLTDQPVNTFTVGFDESMFDESWAAREVAEYHGTDHHEITVSPSTLPDLVPEVLSQLGEPFADPSLLPTYVVARETSRDVKVALSGDGADELFAGYNKYAGEYYSRYYRALPEPVRSHAIEPMVMKAPASRATKTGEFARKAQKFLGSNTAKDSWRHFEWIRLPRDDASDCFGNVSPVDSGREALEEQHQALSGWANHDRHTALARMQSIDTQYVLPNQILHKVDTASMANSLEVRVPFLDLDLVSYSMSLPTTYKITPRTRKRVLRRAFTDVLPDSILERNKHGFDIPIGEWFKRELSAEFRSTIRELDTPIINGSAVLDLHDEHTCGRRDHTRFLWSIYVFAKWFDRMNLTRDSVELQYQR